MSGFKDDVIAILRDNVLLHAEAIGLVMYGENLGETRELLKDLQDRKFAVTDHADKLVFTFDYVILHKNFLFVTSLLKALTLVGSLGIVIVDVTDTQDAYNKLYVSRFGNFSAHKLHYGNRAYIVLKQGNEYGN